MTTYRQIHGRSIQAVTTDPTGDVAEGQIWYNTTTDAFKTVVVGEAWSSASALNTAIYDNAGAGVQDAALNVGGTESPSVARSDNTEEYNGSGWTTSGNLNTARFGLGGFGTQTAAYVAGGNVSPGGGTTAATESYNGTSWTSLSSPANLNTSRQTMPASVMGPGSAGIMFGGSASGSWKNNNEEWNGSAWSEETDLSTARGAIVGAGTQSAATAAGGYNPSNEVALVEEWNGSSWTSGTNLPTATTGGYRVGNSAEDFYYAGGQAPGPVSTTRKYDGTSWTTAPSMGSISAGSGGSPGLSTPSAGIAFGGNNPPPSITTTEEFNKTVNIVTAAAWASATAMPRNHGEHIAGAGSAADGLAFGGEGPSNYNYTEEWNGSSWTAGGNWPSNDESIMACGLTGTTALGFGGINNASPGVRQSTSAKYDGSSWTTTNSLPTAKRAGAGFGINTSAVCMGGDTAPGSANNTVEEWDGTNWTAVPNAYFGMGNMGGGTGTLTAGLIFGGYTPSPGAKTGATYEYDGTNWTSGGTMNTARNQVNGWGGPAGQTASMCGGGSTGSVSAATEGYDGTSWSTRPNLATARQGSANGIGTSQTTGIQAGGSTGSYVTNTEEFTGETTAANVTDFSTE